MVTVVLKGVAKVTSKGKTYYYAWRGGPRLTGKPGTPEFLESFKAATAPVAGLDRSKLAAWVALYRASADFLELAPSTKALWHPWLDRVKEGLGHLSIRQFDRPQIRSDIRSWRDKWRETPRSADYAKQVLSRVLTFAVEEGALTLNVCKDIPNLYTVDRSDVIWEAADLEAFGKVASKELFWVARLAAFTGLRRGDLCALAWGHVGELAIEFKTGKSRGRRSTLIPVTGPLRDLLGEIPRIAFTVLTSQKKRPWTPDGLSMSFWQATRDSGVAARGLHLHDLRGTAATNFWRAGLSLREIAEILAWSEDRVERLIDRYVKRDEILRDRIRRIEQAGFAGRK